MEAKDMAKYYILKNSSRNKTVKKMSKTFGITLEEARNIYDHTLHNINDVAITRFKEVTNTLLHEKAPVSFSTHSLVIGKERIGYHHIYRVSIIPLPVEIKHLFTRTKEMMQYLLIETEEHLYVLEGIDTKAIYEKLMNEFSALFTDSKNRNHYVEMKKIRTLYECDLLSEEVYNQQREALRKSIRENS